jgi:hypothetical protein
MMSSFSTRFDGPVPTHPTVAERILTVLAEMRPA